MASLSKWKEADIHLLLLLHKHFSMKVATLTSQNCVDSITDYFAGLGTHGSVARCDRHPPRLLTQRQAYHPGA